MLGFRDLPIGTACCHPKTHTYSPKEGGRPRLRTPKETREGSHRHQCDEQNSLYSNDRKELQQHLLGNKSETIDEVACGYVDSEPDTN